jgi:hypothetical protein
MADLKEEQLSRRRTISWLSRKIDDLEQAGSDHENICEWLDAFENYAQATILQQLWCESVTRRPEDPDYEARLNTLVARQREARAHLTT